MTTTNRGLTALLRRPARAALAALAAAGLLAGAAGAARDDHGLIDQTSYESPAHGYVVEWDEPWVPRLSDTVHEPGYDTLGLRGPHGDLGVSGIAVGWTPEEYAQTLVEAMEEVLENAAIVDEGEAGGVYYALVTGEEADGKTYVTYVETRELDPDSRAGTVLIMTDLVAAEGDFDEALADALDNVEIDGNPFFTAIDEVDLARLGGGGDDARDDGEDERGRDGSEGAKHGDQAAPNRDGQYVSPSHGYVVRWGDAWVIDPNSTFTEQSLDMLTLIGTDAEVRVMGTSAGWTPEDIVDLFIEDFQRERDVEIVELGVIDGVAYALLEGGTGDDTVMIYVEAQPFDQATDRDGPGVLVTTLLTTGEVFDITIASAVGEIEVDGNPVFALPDRPDDENAA